jgi:hypothetical protein
VASEPGTARPRLYVSAELIPRERVRRLLEREQVNVSSFAAAIAVLAASATAAATTADSPRPAVWTLHTLIVDLRDLPKRYTCDELWYKFKAVLLTLGARPDMKILPYRCERALGSAAYSPKVQLQFSSPRPVSGKDVKWADMQVASKSVRLEPGSPDHIDRQDCELLYQIKSTLLPYLGDPVTGFNLACRAPQLLVPLFGLRVTALVPVSKSQPDVASAVPADRLGPLRSGS